MARDDEKKTPTETPTKGTRTKSTSPRTATSRTPRATTPKPPSGAAGTRARTARTSTGRTAKGKQPTHDDIARRAYEIWQETGNPDPQENWRRAEMELKGRR